MTTRLVNQKLLSRYRMIIATESYPPLITVIHVIMITPHGKRRNMCATLCGDKTAKRAVIIVIFGNDRCDLVAKWQKQWVDPCLQSVKCEKEQHDGWVY